MFAQPVGRPEDRPEEDRSDDAECPKSLTVQLSEQRRIHLPL